MGCVVFHVPITQRSPRAASWAEGQNRFATKPGIALIPTLVTKRSNLIRLSSVVGLKITIAYRPWPGANHPCGKARGQASFVGQVRMFWVDC